MIRHTVVFRLKHPAGSAAEASFLEAADELGAIHGVEKFEKLQQVSPKNNYKFSLSMEFADDRAYKNYNNHPAHRKFVNERWTPEVSEFMEIDYVSMDT
jgi:hypothetical protein